MTKKEAQDIFATLSELQLRAARQLIIQDDVYYIMDDAVKNLTNILETYYPKARRYSVVLFDGRTLDFKTRKEADEFYNTENACELYAYDIKGCCYSLRTREHERF